MLLPCQISRSKTWIPLTPLIARSDGASNAVWWLSWGWDIDCPFSLLPSSNVETRPNASTLTWISWLGLTLCAQTINKQIASGDSAELEDYCPICGESLMDPVTLEIVEYADQVYALDSVMSRRCPSGHMCVAGGSWLRWPKTLQLQALINSTDERPLFVKYNKRIRSWVVDREHEDTLEH